MPPSDSTVAESTSLFDPGYALLIGVGKTPKATWGLEVCDRDVLALRGDFLDATLCAYQPDHVRCMLGEYASRKRIINALRWLRECVQAHKNTDLTVVVYFSGHGWVSADGEYALVPSDVDPDNLAGTLLWANQFFMALKAIEAAHLLIIIDSCFSGGVAGAAVEATAEPPSGYSEETVAPPLYNALKHQPSIAVFGSCSPNEKSYYRREPAQSIYTEVLREGLRGRASSTLDTTVGVTSLMAYFDTHVKARVAAAVGQDKVQTPWYHLTGRGFPIALARGGKGGMGDDTNGPQALYLNIDVLREILLSGALLDADLLLLAGALSPKLRGQIPDWERPKGKVDLILQYCRLQTNHSRLQTYLEQEHLDLYKRYKDRLFHI